WSCSTASPEFAATTARSRMTRLSSLCATSSACWRRGHERTRSSGRQCIAERNGGLTSDRRLYPDSSPGGCGAPCGHAVGFRHFDSVPLLLPHLSLQRRLGPLPAYGRDPDRLSFHSRHSHCVGRRGSSLGDHYSEPGTGRTFRPAQKDCPLDP